LPSSYSLSLFPILIPPLFFSPLSSLRLSYSLQASGRLSRKLAELEEYTCDILATLSTSLFRDVALDKMMSAIKALPAAELKTSPLSNVGAAYACVVLQSNPSAASELKSFFASSASHHASQTGMRTTQHNTMQCNAMQCNAMQCNAMQCNAMQCNAMQCNAMQCKMLFITK
jgi:hypothetical protein